MPVFRNPSAESIKNARARRAGFAFMGGSSPSPTALRRKWPDQGNPYCRSCESFECEISCPEGTKLMRDCWYDMGGCVSWFECYCEGEVSFGGIDIRQALGLEI